MCEIVIPEIHTFKKLESSQSICNKKQNRRKSFATILLYKIKKLLKDMKHEVYERQEE